MNLTQVATLCETSPETITGTLEAIRDEIIEQVLLKKKNAILDFDFGTLHMSATKKTVGFVSGCPVKTVAGVRSIDDKIPFSAEFDR